jgi:hypothetical protein
VKGTLTDGVGKAIEAKFVDFLFYGEKVELVMTDGLGAFNVELFVPYVYRDNLNVSAEYWPRGGDKLVYSPSSSNEVQVKLIYHTPVINVTVPNVVYPGKMFAISGNITWGHLPVSGISVEVAILGSIVTARSGANGRFSVDVSVPSDYPEGLTSIRLMSLGEGVYGPAAASADVEVVRQPLELRVNAPSWAVSGFPVRVQGTVMSDGVPVVNCSIGLESRVGSIVTKTGSDGRFEADLSPPTVLGTESYSFMVSATPVEPWIRSSSVSGEVFMTNLLTLVGGPVLLVAGGYYVSRIIRRRPRSRPNIRESQPVGEPIPLAVAPIAGVEPEGMRDSYASALDLVSRRTGLSPRPSSTLREYLSEVWSSLGEGGRPFRALTMLYERWLYDRAPEVNLGAIRGLLRRVREFFSVEG